MNRNYHSRVLSVCMGYVEMVVERINNKLPEDSRKQGGFFCLSGLEPDEVLLVLQVGSPPPEKWRKYLNLACEKASRLAHHPEHQSSWQSRDPENGQWGGAIRHGDYIWSFSGLTEAADEAAMLHLLNPNFWSGRVPDKDPNITELRAIAEISGNTLYLEP